MGPKWTRRSFLGSLSLAAVQADTAQPGFRRLRDGLTEFEIVRYTDPEYNSFLPASHLRAFSRNGSFLVSMDDSGKLQPFLCEVRTGQRRPLFTCESLDPRTLTFSTFNNAVLCCDGRRLVSSGANSAKVRTICEVEPGWERAGAMHVSDLGTVCFAENRGVQTRLRTITIARGAVSTALEADGAIDFLAFRPRRSSFVYVSRGRAFFVSSEGGKPRELPLAAGAVRQPRWNADGRTLLYLSVPDDRKQLIQLREYTVEGDTDKLVAKTSQFAGFARNGDASVFAGVSANRASPCVLLLVRAGRREMTVCEHRSSHPEDVQIFFTPNSQRLLFDTDRHGKSVVYGMALDRLVDETEE